MAGTESSLDAFKEVRNDKSVDTTRKMRVGIIGTGWIAGAHIKSYLNQPDVEIVAGADLIPGKAEKFFSDWGVKNVKCYPSHKEMLDDGRLSSTQSAYAPTTASTRHPLPTLLKRA